jgi:hypothetical protein
MKDKLSLLLYCRLQNGQTFDVTKHIINEVYTVEWCAAFQKSIDIEATWFQTTMTMIFDVLLSGRVTSGISASGGSQILEFSVQ